MHPGRRSRGRDLDIASGVIDTVIVAFTDMQGRLQGKRIHAQFFLDSVLGHGTEEIGRAHV